MKKRIECIKRLIAAGHFYEFTEWLEENKLIKPDDYSLLTRDQEKAELVYGILTRAEQNEILVLLDFEWVLLPLETIRITCVTETEKKEFTYGL